mmetsp:Transcript_32812/g.49470  ORF Transcript_32812/g.49470 Transcript_32812/m.49470 type:complete len:438 (-) Transcript_32812:204-1517(-)
MITRKEAFQTENEQEFSILSWNILAPSLDRNQSMNWPKERLPSILEELQSCQADILCLQEVEKNSMEHDLLPALDSYDGVRADDIDAASVATFWKTEKYELHHVWSKSRNMICILREKRKPNTAKSSRNLAVVNVHLDEHPERVFTRVQQLELLMKQLRLHQRKITAIIICGDFGCPQRQSACTSFLMQGNLPLKSVVENNRPFDVSGSIRPHSFRFASSYSFSRLPVSVYFDYAGNDGCYAAGIDQLWHTQVVIKTKRVRETFSSEEQREAILEEGMPSRWNPSDHMPIGAVLEWQDETATLLSDDEESSSISIGFVLSDVSDDDTSILPALSELSDDTNDLLDGYHYDVDAASFVMLKRGDASCSVTTVARIEKTSFQNASFLQENTNSTEKAFIETCVQVLVQIGTRIPKNSEASTEWPVYGWFRMFYDGLMCF